MDLGKIIARFLTKLTLLSFLAVLPFVSVTQALYSDTETSEGNNFMATSLDLGYTSPTTNFQPDTLLPGESANRSATVANLGVLPFEFDQAAASFTGDPGLCNALQLEVRDTSNTLVYNNLLSLFTLPGVSPLSSGNSTDFSFKVILPAGSSPSLGNQSCSFNLVAKAWQVGGTYGSGFDDIELLSNTINTGSWSWVSGMKFNDLDGDGTKEEGENGLPDWTIYAGTLVENFNVNSNGTPAVSSVLETGQKYFVRVSGTFSAGDSITADAKYSVRAPNTVWTDSVQNYESYGPTLLDLQIDGSSPDWGAFNDDHVYWLTLIGAGAAKSFQIYDIYSPNNVGSLSVTIYRVVGETLTDTNGNYLLELNTITGPVVVAEQTQSGWSQTAPMPLGYYQETLPATLSGRDFGNLPTPNPEQPNSFQAIVLNEIMYNPVGDEGASMPNGEWVELYNNSDATIDVAGWKIKDLVNNTITVSTTNSDNNLNTADSGETSVPAHGWLVVYRNGSAYFNNSGDTLYLLNNLNVLMDSHAYRGGKAEGLTEARSPDGTGAWVDPLPTPGRKNTTSLSDLDPQVHIWQQDSHNARVGIFDSNNYSEAIAEIYYNHREAGMNESQQEQIIKTISTLGISDIYATDIYFGTTSTPASGITNYYPHTNIQNVYMKVTLKGTGGLPDRVLTTQLEGNWTP